MTMDEQVERVDEVVHLADGLVWPERDAELVARVEARVEEAGALSSIPPMDPEETARAVGAKVVPVDLPGELSEERSVIEAFLEDGGLTEREEGLATLWLRWDDQAHGKPWPGRDKVHTTQGKAEEVRSRVYRVLATSYAGAAGRPGSKVRSGEDPRRHNEEGPVFSGPVFGGLVLTNEPLASAGLVAAENVERATAFAVEMESEELVEREPVLTEEMFEFDGSSDTVLAWLEQFVQARGDDIEAQQRELDDQRTVCDERMAYLLRRKILLDGQRMVVGALLTAMEEGNDRREGDER